MSVDRPYERARGPFAKEPVAAGVVVAWLATGPQRKVNAPLLMHGRVTLSLPSSEVDTVSTTSYS
jgi:hypothetical protein